MNIELWDRVIRILVGVTILSAILLFNSQWKWLGLLGLVPLMTGIVGWCPIYAWFSQD
jgi:cadmium resistance protein CadD (predicted permease)